MQLHHLQMMGSRLYTEKGLAITNNHQQLKPCHPASKQICNCAGEQYSTQGSTRHNSLYMHSAERLYQFLLGTAQPDPPIQAYLNLVNS